RVLLATVVPRTTAPVLDSRWFTTLRVPPGSPLFPYTTLFRSEIGAGGVAEAVALAGVLGAEALQHGGLGCIGLSPEAAQLGVEQDRKSTRLNSSHVKISYAVFCLKKKHDIHHSHRHTTLFTLN